MSLPVMPKDMLPPEKWTRHYLKKFRKETLVETLMQLGSALLQKGNEEEDRKEVTVGLIKRCTQEKASHDELTARFKQEQADRRQVTDILEQVVRHLPRA